MDKEQASLKDRVKAAEERIRRERRAQDRADWEGNHPEERG